MSSSNQRPANRGFRSVLRCATSHYRQVPSLSAPEPLAAVGADGVRLYTAPPLIPDRSGLARAQARMWADDNSRLTIARRMYSWRLGEVFPHRSLDVLRGIEGARMKESYRLLARQIGVHWSGRHYDRAQPQSADLPNQAINHASSAVEGAAAIAVASTGTIPQLGFIHEDPGQSFVLDIADLYRDTLTIPCAFRSAKRAAEHPEENIERVTRRLTGKSPGPRTDHSRHDRPD